MSAAASWVFHPRRDEAIATAVLELVAEGGGELLVHHQGCATGRGEACSCTPEFHLIWPTKGAPS